MASSHSSSDKAFFDVHTTGCGFIRRIREVTPRGKNSGFLACSIGALSGSSDGPVYRYFDVRVSSANAQALIRAQKARVDAGQPVLIAFRIGDAYPDVFVRTHGANSGISDAGLKGRLLSARLLEGSALSHKQHHPLLTHGLGYLKHIAQSAKDISQRYCSIVMLNGPVHAPEYRHVDATVFDPSLVHLLDQVTVDTQAKRKVLISFQLDDLQASFFTRTRGENAGEQVPVLRTMLSAISTIKVDGTEVYRDSLKAPTDCVEGGGIAKTA